jgi:hypothetical protein
LSSSAIHPLWSLAEVTALLAQSGHEIRISVDFGGVSPRGNHLGHWRHAIMVCLAAGGLGSGFAADSG